MIAAIISLAGIGFLAALTLGIAAKKFAVEVDERETRMLEILPGANCGACGFPGCAGYARAVVDGKVAANLCTPGGQGVIDDISEILGIDAVMAEPVYAVVMCQGDNNLAKEKYRYFGVADCNAAQRLASGPKVCPGGCLGLGSCVDVCPFGAIEITSAGLAVISRDLCTGCGNCIDVCPRTVIRLVPRSAAVHVLCNSDDKGAVVRKYCSVGCIGCFICQKNAAGVYLVENHLAKVVYDFQGDSRPGLEKCPMKSIRDFREGYPQGSHFQPVADDETVHN